MTQGRAGFESKRAYRILFAAIPIALLALVLSMSPATAAHATGNVTAYQASDAVDGNATAIESAIENGSLRPAEELVLGDSLVVAIPSDRLASSMAATNGSTTDRFFAALTDTSAEFRIIQTNPTPQQTRKVARLGQANVTVYRKGSMTYLLVDTGNVTFHHRGSNRSTDIFGDERFIAHFGYNVTDYPDDAASASRPFGLHPVHGTFYSGRYTYDPLPPEWVQLSVNIEIEPVRSLVVRATFEDDRTITKEVEPAEPGFKHIWLDLRPIAPGTDYTLELVHDGLVIDRYSGTITRPRAVISNATLTEVSTELRVTRDGQRVTNRIDNHTAVNATVTLTHGGKVQVLDRDCEQVGYAWVEPGNETQVTMKLWRDGTPLRGLNQRVYGVRLRALRNQGASHPLYDAGRPTATLNINGSCRNLAQTPTPPATPSPTTHRTTVITTSPPTESTTGDTVETTTHPPSVETSETAETSTPGQPGFTVVTIGVSLLGLLLLRRT